MDLCQGICKNGKPCKRRVVSGSYCYHHNEEFCVLCMEKKKEKNMIKLECCGQMICLKCRNKWIKSCPNCKSTLEFSDRVLVVRESIYDLSHKNDLSRIGIATKLKNTKTGIILVEWNVLNIK